jgi:hypothetical protein
MRKLVLLAVLGLTAPAFAADPAAAVVGTWRGESLCMVKPSPCHDEVIVYRFARGKAPDAVVLTGNKVVDGKELEMGTLDCRVDGAGVDCPIGNGKGTFKYIVDGKTMRGTLVLADGTVFRKVSAKKD